MKVKVADLKVWGTFTVHIPKIVDETFFRKVLESFREKKNKIITKQTRPF